VIIVIYRIQRPNATSDEKKKSILSKQRKVYMLLLATACFALFWGPEQIFSIQNILGGYGLPIGYPVLFHVAAIFGILSCSVNPVIFIAFSDILANKLKKVLNSISQSTRRSEI
jgi:hypothetical protein